MAVMPDKGFHSINVTEEVYGKVKLKAEKEKKSITAYASHILASYMEADEKLSRYAPFIEVVGFEGNSIILRDHKLNRIIEVYLHEKEITCVHDDSKDCVHVSFCLALPQTTRVLQSY
jgi:hypothetical protein